MEAGKKQLLTSVYEASENAAAVAEDLAVQALLSRHIVDLLTVRTMSTYRQFVGQPV